MNLYQLLLLACIYAIIAYGAYRERKANYDRVYAQHYWHIPFIFCSLPLGAFLFLSLFAFLGTL